MFRRAIVPLMLAALTAHAAPRTSPVASAAAKARAGFGAELRSSESIFTGATAGFAQQMAAGTLTPEAAVDSYGAAFSFFVLQVKRHSDAASAAMAASTSAAMDEADDPVLEGALAGDAGALDRFDESIRRSLDAARRRLLVRAQRFAAKLARTTVRSRMLVTAPAWTFERRAAPTPGGPLAPRDEPIRLLGSITVRRDDGTVVVFLAGSAPASLSGRFDARLVAGTDEGVVGPKLSAGGMSVEDDGTWSASKTMNDPHMGEDFKRGNRIARFGVEPYDAGPAGVQPARYQQAGVIGVP